ncbi:Ca-activated chloride channel family protein [Marinobacter daqiaonensis]|uniref:Ca-activated chloride channel family protein n=1 Tax=Marinobacter daqiaonensis TaxID=650891 RepID=A0A1I6H5K5_9GAMM|nr:VWA domain-containing protein [Marinobacter daqiaonensis]SFR49670.1 Ca-activated chloride channel family protein [Marinobacter daqiaonensis]
MVTLAWPWLLALLPLPWLLRWLRPPAPGPATRSPAPMLPFQGRLMGMPGVRQQGGRKKPWQTWLLVLAWLLLVVALARPQHVGEATTLPVSGRDLMLAVDISPSMEERDMVLQGRALNRLEALKVVLDEFIRERQGDRLGLLLFGSQPYIQAPLTFDHTTLRTLLLEAGLGMAGRATAIGDAIGLAVKRLRERPQQHRVLVLLTDGANTAGSLTPQKATEIAADAGVRIHTIGIGAETGRQRGLFGSRQVNPSRDLDEGLLTEIALTTGGQYFRARNLEELQGVYQEIDRLEPLELESKPWRPTTELYAWPGALAALLWVGGFLLSHGLPRWPTARYPGNGGPE